MHGGCARGHFSLCITYLSEDNLRQRGVMDCTTVSVGSQTRDELKAYRDERELQNMNEAICDLLAKRKGGDSRR